MMMTAQASTLTPKIVSAPTLMTRESSRIMALAASHHNIIEVKLQGRNRGAQLETTPEVRKTKMALTTKLVNVSHDVITALDLVSVKMTMHHRALMKIHSF